MLQPEDRVTTFVLGVELVADALDGERDARVARPRRQGLDLVDGRHQRPAMGRAARAEDPPAPRRERAPPPLGDEEVAAAARAQPRGERR